MPTPETHAVDVPGARLHYDIRGSGPPLLLVGHPMTASGFEAMATLLASEYTVVTFDPRGFARSSIDDPDQDAEPDLLADDVRRVLEAAGTVPAHVFGSSGGAVTGLALITLFPGHVDTLIAHEPPVGLLLPDAKEVRADFQEIYDCYRHEGVSAAWARFMSFTGLDPGPQAGVADQRPPSPEVMATSDRFFAHGLLPIALYQPDLPALTAAKARIVVAGGSLSVGEFPHRTAIALAEHLGTPLVEFPGGHVGFATDPPAFVDVLHRTLA